MMTQSCQQISEDLVSEFKENYYMFIMDMKKHHRKSRQWNFESVCAPFEICTRVIWECTPFQPIRSAYIFDVDYWRSLTVMECKLTFNRDLSDSQVFMFRTLWRRKWGSPARRDFRDDVSHPNNFAYRHRWNHYTEQHCQNKTQMI